MSGSAAIAPATKSRESPGRKGVTTEARFAENNQKQYGIRPHMIFLHYINHILIDMENKI